MSLRGLASPRHVVRARLAPRETLYDHFQGGPETNQLKRVVEPACRDAVVRLVGAHVMDAVMAPRQDQMQVLQGFDVPW